MFVLLFLSCLCRIWLKSDCRPFGFCLEFYFVIKMYVTVKCSLCCVGTVVMNPVTCATQCYSIQFSGWLVLRCLVRLLAPVYTVYSPCVTCSLSDAVCCCLSFPCSSVLGYFVLFVLYVLFNTPRSQILIYGCHHFCLPANSLSSQVSQPILHCS